MGLKDLSVGCLQLGFAGFWGLDCDESTVKFVWNRLEDCVHWDCATGRQRLEIVLFCLDMSTDSRERRDR